MELGVIPGSWSCLQVRAAEVQLQNATDVAPCFRKSITSKRSSVALLLHPATPAQTPETRERKGTGGSVELFFKINCLYLCNSKLKYDLSGYLWHSKDKNNLAESTALQLKWVKGRGIETFSLQRLLHNSSCFRPSALLEASIKLQWHTLNMKLLSSAFEDYPLHFQYQCNLCYFSWNRIIKMYFTV